MGKHYIFRKKHQQITIASTGAGFVYIIETVSPLWAQAVDTPS